MGVGGGHAGNMQIDRIFMFMKINDSGGLSALVPGLFLCIRQ